MFAQLICCEDEIPPKVTISGWEYCQGCKQTVEICSKVTAKELKLLDKLPKGQKKVLDAVKITDLLCDNPLFEAYGQFGKFSCIKVLEDSDHRLKFMEEFTGSTSISKLLSKKSIFDRKKKVFMSS